jgi:hypothetical protein
LPPRWAPVTEVLVEVDEEDSDNFDEDEDALGVTDEQRALLASFESARRDQAGRQLMVAERQALSERRATTQNNACETTHKGNRAATAAWGDDKDDDLMHRAVVAVVCE